MFRFAFLIMMMVGTAYAEPNDIIARPLVLSQGQVDVELVGGIDASENELGRPLSISPDIWIGVLPKLTVGLIHSNQSVDQIQSDASFCVRTGGTPPAECDAFYHGGGIDLLWSALEGHVAVAPRLRVLVHDLEAPLGTTLPTILQPAMTLGAALRWTSGRFAIYGDPYLQIGLANNDKGNRSALWLPIVASIQPTCRWAIDLHTGWSSDLYIWRDGWHVPAEVGVRARATKHLDLSTAFGFTTILGPQNTPKERVLFVTAGWRT